jgi:hypothetical protein
VGGSPGAPELFGRRFRGDPTFRWVSAVDRAAAVAQVEREAALDEAAFHALWRDADALEEQEQARNAEQVAAPPLHPPPLPH